MNLIRKAPNLFIIGAAKAGTTSLYDILYSHPQVYFPFVKEPAYFCDDEYFSRGEEWYLKTYFENVKEQPIRGEATSRYLYFANKVAPRIYEFSYPHSPKFIAIFRDPVKLVYSFYWNSVREGHEALNFNDALRAEKDRMIKLQTQLERNGQILYAYSQVGLYAQQVMKYLKLFPKELFMFLITEELMDFSTLSAKLQAFLGLQNTLSHVGLSKSNRSALPKSNKLHQWLRNRSVIKDILKPLIPFSIRYKLKMSALEMNLKEFTPPELDPEIANSLRRYYSEETKCLQDIIQRDLSSWLPA